LAGCRRTHRNEFGRQRARACVGPGSDRRIDGITKENAMKQVLSAAAILCLALVSSAGADSNDGKEKKSHKDSLPRESTVQWEVQVLEDSPSFEVVKREVKGNTVTWVLENKRNLGTEIVFGYQAMLYDQDGVRLGTIGIEINPSIMNMPKGERNRFLLHLPQPDKWKNVRKVIIKNGEYGG
jgi:hypothetical protein